MKIVPTLLVVLAVNVGIAQTLSSTLTNSLPSQPRDDPSPQQVSDDDDEPSKGVVGIPPRVIAGESTIWHLDISKSSSASENHTRMEIYLRAWPQDPARTNLTYYFSALYCHIVECVRTNLTSFAVTIPKDAFPDGVRMRTSFQLSDSPDVNWSHWGDAYTEFVLEGGTGKWSEYELTEGWTPVNHWSTALDCTKVTCARSCIEQNLDVSRKWYYAQTSEAKAAFTSCIQACEPRPQGYRPSQCLSSNTTTVLPATSSTITSPVPAPDSPSPAQTTAPANNASLPSNILSLALSLGAIIAYVLQLM